MTENEKTELFDKWYDENYDEWAEGEEFGYNKTNEWHDLREDPNDLPKEGTEVLNDDGVKVVRINGHWRYVYGDVWEDDAHLDHWCEIPTFDKE